MWYEICGVEFTILELESWSLACLKCLGLGGSICFCSNLKCFYFKLLFFMFLDCFNMLVLKIIFFFKIFF